MRLKRIPQLSSQSGQSGNVQKGKKGQYEFAKLLFFFLITLGTGAIFVLTPDLLPSALISILIFFIFSPWIDSMERKGVNRSQAIFSLFLLCGLCIALVTTLIIPQATQEIDNFKKGRDKYVSGIMSKFDSAEQSLSKNIPMFQNAKLTERALEWAQGSGDKILGWAPNLASQILMALFLVPFFSFILLKDAHEIRRGILKMVPNRYFETVYGLMYRMMDEIGGFISARIFEAFLVSAMLSISLLVFDIKYSILLGLFAGATNAIPYLGPVLGAAPAIILAFLEPTVHNQVAIVAIIFVVANAIDMVVIFPILVSKIVDLHPVIVIVAVILGSQFLGVLGMIIAVPITSIIKILFQEIYSRLYSQTDNA